MDSAQAVKNVLFVGEGNFSYSAHYLHTSKCGLFFATCLETERNRDSKTEANIQFIKKHGGKVLFGVDANFLHEHEILKLHMFTHIIFNFPHTNKKMNIRDNRQLVLDFLRSAKCLLSENGKIYLSLCKGQGGTEGETSVRAIADSWKVVYLAADCDLILNNIELFDAKNYDSYECTGFRGQNRTFNVSDAVTHVFSKGTPFDIQEDPEIDESEMETNVDFFRAELKILHESASTEQDKPFTRVFGIMAQGLDRYKDVKQVSVFVPKLVLCRRAIDGFLSTSSYDLVNKFDMCAYCLYCVLSFLEKQENTVLYSIVCTSCCVECFKVERPAITHVASYFSKCKQTLKGCLDSIFEKFEDPSNKKLLRKPVCSWNTFVTDLKEDTVVADDYFDIDVDDDKSVLKTLTGLKTSPIYACYTVIKHDCKMFYTDIKIVMSDEERFELDREGGYIKIGCNVEFSDKNETYFGAIFNLESIATIKFHILDYRLIFSNLSFYSDIKLEDETVTIFRSPSLYPPSFVHDVSFWVHEVFLEKYMYLLVQKTAECLIKKIHVTDIYTDPETNRHSRCYRFTYQSCDRPLSEASANRLHTHFVRNVLQKHMKISLR